ncbi:unnamed protein product [Umbelopsis vinacea]
MLRLRATRTQLLKLSQANTVRNMSAFSHMSDNDPQILEEAKKKQLEAHEKDKKWEEKLASQSEAAVKADKSEDKPLDRLQKETIEELKKNQQ